MQKDAGAQREARIKRKMEERKADVGAHALQASACAWEGVLFQVITRVGCMVKTVSWYGREFDRARCAVFIPCSCPPAVL